MPSIIIASDKSNSGKTMVRSVILSYLKSAGISVSTISSFSKIPSSVKEGLELSEAEIIPGFEDIDMKNMPDQYSQKISDLISKNSKKNILISESNSTDMNFNRNLAEASKSKILLVTDAKDNIDKIRSELGEYLVGIIYNNTPRHKVDSLKSEKQNDVISIIPENRFMVSSTVDQYVKHLKGKYLYESEKKNELVLNVLIGGIVLDWSVLYYESQKDVLALIRGDRPDLQLGAMQAGGNVKGLVLTKGIEPIEYVFYEAQKLEIPLILVDSDTHDTADKISGIVSKSIFDHPDKLNSCLSYFKDNMSQDAVDKALELNTL
ncbi:MAG: hypothetical protein CL762_01015 [Chloroflexi bacterium]|nr:hypothetical protein [Chloroflexota bacterium]|tara:strand:- start:17828 stop:18790 length:963 start_codon:yes stop_codon:yes gene_type:complete